MTEKRFGYVTEELCYGVTDNGKFLSPIDCMHLLNEQHETIQQLQRDNQDLIAENVRLMNKLWRSDVE